MYNTIYISIISPSEWFVNVEWTKVKKDTLQMQSVLKFTLVRNVGEKCHLASSLNSYGELSLVKSASAGNTSGKNFCSFRNKLSEFSGILVIDVRNLILTEDANLLSSVHGTESGTLSIVLFHLNSP